MRKMNSNSLFLLSGLSVMLLFQACKDDDAPAPAPVPVEENPTVATVSPLSGSTGTPITITGTNFKATAAENAVTVNGVAAVVTSASPTQLVVTVPAKAGDGVVAVTVAGKTATGPQFDYLESYLISTFAGSSQGTADGTGTSAQFQDPWNIAADANGNLYVTEYASHRIRKITPEGVVTTFAGSSQGYADGSGTSAQFNGPTAIAVDAQNNVYVTEYDGHRIRKITPEGVVSTVAGTGTAGFADGPAALSAFNTPSGIAVDAEGNLYISDRNNTRVRKITAATGVVSTLAGNGTVGQADGTGPAAEFNAPSGLTIDGEGNLYLTDTDNHLIRKITPAGVVTTLAGSGQIGAGGEGGFADGTGNSAQFYYPWSIAIGSENELYVADYFNHRIRMITPEGVVSTIAGTGAAGNADGGGIYAGFNRPGGVAVAADGTIYIADSENFRIRKITFE